AGGIQKLLKNAVVETRNLARGIFPVQMDEEGLPPALEELVTNMNYLRHTSIGIEIDGDVIIKEPQVSMHLYRIAQEALNNAVKHSGASRITIRLSQLQSHFSMSISDNGSGFVTGVSSSMGMGLSTMRYRAQLIGANLQVQSSPTKGTLVECSLPIA